MKTRYFFIAVLTFSLFVFSVSAQWTQSDGIYGGYCASVAFNGTDILTGTYYTGVHKSSNYGTAWTQTSLNWGSANAITATDGNLVAGIGRYIYKSTDAGTTWTQTIDIGKNVACLVSDNNRVFAGISNYNGGVYYSLNGGSNWIQSSLQQNINTVAIKGDTIFAGDNEFGLFRSVDNGITWTGTSLGYKSITALTVSGNYVIAGTKYHEIFVSDDNGDSWISVNLPGESWYVYSLASAGNNIYAGLRDPSSHPAGVWVSQDHGYTWTQTSLTDKHVISLAANGSSVLAGTLYYGAYFSADNGLTWTQTALNCREVLSLESIDNHLFAGTGSTFWTNSPEAIGGVYTSDNGGISWSFSGMPDRQVFSLKAAGNKLYAGTSSLPNPATAGLLVSDNYGLSWSQTMLNNAPVLSLTSYGQNMYAGLYGAGVYYSPDGGTAWWQTKMTGNEVISMFADSGYVLAGRGYDHGIFRSEDLGETWVNVQNAMSPTCFAKIDSVLFCGSGLGIHRSFDSGLTWTRIQMPYTQVNSLAVYNNILFIATNSGVYYSVDQGEQWNEMNQGFIGIPLVTSLMINNDILYAATKHYSVWQRSLPEILSTDDLSAEKFMLGQNYPNPVLRLTKIDFGLPKATHVRLTVYNMSGYKVATLYDAYTQAGNHTVEYDASLLPAGIYLYRIESDGNSYTRRMVKVNL